MVYLTTTPAQRGDWLVAATLHAGSDAVISGAAAACARGLRTVRFPDRILALVGPSSAAQSWGPIHVRRTRRLPQVRAGPGTIRIAEMARAVADLAVATRDDDAVQAVVCEAIQRGRCTVDELVRELKAGPRRGSAGLRRALVGVGYGVHSVPEVDAGRLLRAARISGFEHNAIIELPDGALRGDIVWRAHRAVLEIDSVEHHLSAADHAGTLRRDHRLQAAGWMVLHVRPSQLRPTPTAS